MKIYFKNLFILFLFIINAGIIYGQDIINTIDSGYIIVDGRKLFYEIAGEGKNIVLIYDAKREIIFKAGHLIPLEQPAAFNESVWEFFKNEKIL